MAAEKKGMKGPLVVGAVVFLLLWFVFSMSFFGSLVAAAAAGAIAHFAFGDKAGAVGDTATTVAASDAGAEVEEPAPVADPEPAPKPATAPDTTPEPEAAVVATPEPEVSPEPAPAADAAPDPEPVPDPAAEPKAEAEKPTPEASGSSTLLAGEEELASRKGTWKYDPSGN